MATKLKILLQIFVLVLFLGLLSMPAVYGAESTACRNPSGGYCINFAAAAVPATGLEFLGDATGLGDLISRLYIFGMGFVGIAAFIMFMIGGVQYLVAGDKDPTEAKNRMKNAAIGLGVALISWLILFTINPDLVKKLSLNYLTKIEYTPQESCTGGTMWCDILQSCAAPDRCTQVGTGDLCDCRGQTPQCVTRGSCPGSTCTITASCANPPPLARCDGSQSCGSVVIGQCLCPQGTVRTCENGGTVCKAANTRLCGDIRPRDRPCPSSPKCFCPSNQQIECSGRIAGGERVWQCSS